YSCHPWEGRLILADDRHLPRMDQGERCFRFWINGGSIGERLASIDREALSRNERPTALSFFPPGGGSRPRPLLMIEDPAVVAQAVKKAEDGGDIIVRLFNPTSRRRRARIRLPALGARADLRLGPFEIRTLRVSPRTKRVVETDLLERPLRKASVQRR
ncbi:MAG: alpha-mannosidase, partial [Planctomycetes bacterium]|nr:alpha-mannosidase [Planctomycetota bacterium]